MNWVVRSSDPSPRVCFKNTSNDIYPKNKKNWSSAEEANYFDLARYHSLLDWILSHLFPDQLQYFLVMWENKPSQAEKTHKSPREPHRKEERDILQVFQKLMFILFCAITFDQNFLHGISKWHRLLYKVHVVRSS